MGPWTRTGRALADDDELFARQYGADRPPKRGRPRLSEWDQFDELCATLRDAAERLAVVIASQNIPKGKSRPKFKPELRPRTASERAELMRDVATVAEIVEMATPWADPPRRT
jgi:hypothetical protein